jgi:hypothetical protein
MASDCSSPVVNDSAGAASTHNRAMGSGRMQHRSMFDVLWLRLTLLLLLLLLVLR